MITERNVRSSSRHSLQVRRYHVWPMLQEQRTDAHSLQMLRIYGCIWGPPPAEVAWEILWHDAGEGDAGDCQFGAKRRYPELKAALDAAEAAQEQLVMETDFSAAAMAAAARLPPLSQRELWRVKAVDLIEGYEHALQDVAMGNRLAVPVVDAYAGGLRHWVVQAQDEDVTALDNYLGRAYARKLINCCEAARRDFDD